MIVVNFDRRIDAQRDRNLFRFATRAVNNESDFFERLDSVLHSQQIERLSAVELQRSGASVVLKLARQHAHADQIAAMDSFKTLRDHGSNTEQPRSLRGPVARTAGAVLLPGKDHERYAGFLITHRGVVDAHAVAVGLINRDA